MRNLGVNVLVAASSIAMGFMLANIAVVDTPVEAVREIEDIPVTVEIVEVQCEPTKVDQCEQREVAIHEAKRIEAEQLNTFDTYEMALMAKVVRAEAGNQDDVGKRLVVDCILNRLDSNHFPNTVEGVVTQENQFTSYQWYTQDDWDAVVDEVVDRTDNDIVFFRTGHYSTHGEPAYQYGDHYFSAEN